jgi:hypothetical protein
MCLLAKDRTVVPAFPLPPPLPLPLPLCQNVGDNGDNNINDSGSSSGGKTPMATEVVWVVARLARRGALKNWLTTAKWGSPEPERSFQDKPNLLHLIKANL